ncbi:MAG: hypothetical protein WAW31_05585 [Smithella sp.]
MKEQISIENTKGQIILYKNKLEVRLEEDTVWVSLNQLTDLFERDKSVISRHLRNIYSEEELINGRQLLHFLQQFKTRVVVK